MRRLRPPTLRPTEQPTASARPTPPLGSPQILSGAITSGQMALTQETQWPQADFTTSNTSAWQDVTSLNIPVPTGNMAFYAWASFAARHTAAGAEVSSRLGVYIDDALSTAYSIANVNNTYLATANKYHPPISLTAGINVPSNMPLLVPGTRRLVLQVFNHTAGTLTIDGDVLPNAVLHALVAGDST